MDALFAFVILLAVALVKMTQDYDNQKLSRRRK